MRMIYWTDITARGLTDYSNPLYNYLNFPFSYCRFLQVVVLITALTVRTHTHYYLLMKVDLALLFWQYEFCGPSVNQNRKKKLWEEITGYLSTNSEICISRMPKTINCNTWRSPSLFNFHQNTSTDAD